LNWTFLKPFGHYCLNISFSPLVALDAFWPIMLALFLGMPPKKVTDGKTDAVIVEGEFTFGVAIAFGYPLQILDEPLSLASLI
jgi:hypothetical protein